MRFTIECEQEEDGRWIAQVIELPGVLAYGRTREEAMFKVQALAVCRREGFPPNTIDGTIAAI